MKKRNVFNLIVCLVMAFLVMFVVTGCLENPDRDRIYDNSSINQSDNNGENGEDSKNENPTTINIIGLGDSIAAGYAVEGTDMYASYTAFDGGEVGINEMCYTNIIATQFSGSYDTVNVKSYAQSGDKTSDLVAKFDNVNVANDIENANIITLCIGANNVLTVALDNMADYFAGFITIDDVETLLQDGLANFKTDYDFIVPYLTQFGAQIYVMTVYDPYYYFNVNDISFESEIIMGVNVKQQLKTKFDSIKSLAINYLNQVNDYIKSSSNENVHIVDVNTIFKNLTKSQYSLCINADSTRIQIATSDIVSIFLSHNLTSLSASQYFDPHPTSLGQKYIANLFLTAMEMDIIEVDL